MDSSTKVDKKKHFKTKKNIDIISEPIGVVLLFIPWNYPFIVLIENTFILAAGCGVIIKPSEFAATSLDFVVKAIKKSVFLRRSISCLWKWKKNRILFSKVEWY